LRNYGIYGGSTISKYGFNRKIMGYSNQTWQARKILELNGAFRAGKILELTGVPASHV
jgi:hypothetical protein